MSRKNGRFVEIVRSRLMKCDCGGVSGLNGGLVLQRNERQIGKAELSEPACEAVGFLFVAGSNPEELATNQTGVCKAKSR